MLVSNRANFNRPAKNVIVKNEEDFLKRMYNKIVYDRLKFDPDLSISMRFVNNDNELEVMLTQKTRTLEEENRKNIYADNILKSFEDIYNKYKETSKASDGQTPIFNKDLWSKILTYASEMILGTGGLYGAYRGIRRITQPGVVNPTDIENRIVNSSDYNLLNDSDVQNMSETMGEKALKGIKKIGGTAVSAVKGLASAAMLPFVGAGKIAQSVASVLAPSLLSLNTLINRTPIQEMATNAYNEILNRISNITGLSHDELNVVPRESIADAITVNNLDALKKEIHDILKIDNIDISPADEFVSVKANEKLTTEQAKRYVKSTERGKRLYNYMSINRIRDPSTSEIHNSDELIEMLTANVTKEEIDNMINRYSNNDRYNTYSASISSIKQPKLKEKNIEKEKIINNNVVFDHNKNIQKPSKNAKDIQYKSNQQVSDDNIPVRNLLYEEDIKIQKKEQTVSLLGPKYKLKQIIPGDKDEAAKVIEFGESVNEYERSIYEIISSMYPPYGLTPAYINMLTELYNLLQDSRAILDSRIIGDQEIQYLNGIVEQLTTRFIFNKKPYAHLFQNLPEDVRNNIIKYKKTILDRARYLLKKGPSK